MKISSNDPSGRSKRHETVKWSRIFCTLESSISDILILLDCTGAGSFTSTDGEGITELIAPCAYKESPNTINQPSFTGVLINTLQRLSRMPSFTANYLYNCLLKKCQAVPGSRGYKIDPIHIILGQENSPPRSIRFPTNFKPTTLSMEPGIPLQFSSRPADLDDLSSTHESGDERRMITFEPTQAPALFLTIRIHEFAELEDLSAELFREWLGGLPIPTDLVLVQWGSVSF
jgi:hypothetical protein